jgi:uncharacterized membrane protein
MTRYDLWLFLHVVAAIVWLGGGLMLQVLGLRAERLRDSAGMRRLAEDGAVLGNRVFIPASLAVLVFGLLMVIDGPWGFGTLWVTLGLVGYAATLLTGVLVIKPATERIAAAIERDGGEVRPETAREMRRVLAKGRVDILGLYLVVAVMVLKPTGDDVAVLLVMAALLVAMAIRAAALHRAIDAEQPEAATA